MSEKCAETIYRGAWSRRSACSRAAGFGKDGLYCRQHSGKHLDESTKPVAIWWRVRNSEYSCSIEAVEVLEVADKTLVIKRGVQSSREAKTSQYESYLPTKEAAVEYYRQKIAGLRARADKMEQELTAKGYYERSSKTN